MTPATITNAVRRAIPTLSSADLDRVQHAVAEAMIPMRGRFENADRLLRKVKAWYDHPQSRWEAEFGIDDPSDWYEEIDDHLVAGVKETR